MSEFDLLSVAASGMQAQRSALTIAARNVAAAEAAGPGGSYERLVPEFSVVRDAAGEDDGGEAIAVTGSHRERGSNIDLLTEMIGVMNASRAYEANASVFDLGKRLAERTIDMGRL
jgi:flagellar basal-body rod protein FlgC